MSSLVSCFLTLRLHLSHSDFDSRQLVLVSLFLSSYIHMYSQSHLGDIFECCFKAQSSKLEGIFCHVSVKRDVRALSFKRAFENVTPSGIGCTC